MTQGWTGKKCPQCKGCGEVYNRVYDCDKACPACAGTGEEYGEIKDSSKEIREPDKGV